MVNTAILVIVVLVLISSLKRLYNILTVGSFDKMIKKRQASLDELKEDANKPNANTLFCSAWLFSLIYVSVMVGLSVYVLTNILNFA